MGVIGIIESGGDPNRGCPSYHAVALPTRDRQMLFDLRYSTNNSDRYSTQPATQNHVRNASDALSPPVPSCRSCPK